MNYHIIHRVYTLLAPLAPLTQAAHASGCMRRARVTTPATNIIRNTAFILQEM